MNDSTRSKTEKSSKRSKQRELKDNHRQNKPKSQSLTPKGSLKYQRRYDESRQEEINGIESELRRRSLSTGKPVWERIVEADTHQTQKSKENKNKGFHKNLLKPTVYQDPALLQLRAEKQKQRTEKTLLKQRKEEKKVQQRREIYALNEVMKELEHSEFEEFCNIAGIYPEE